MKKGIVLGFCALWLFTQAAWAQEPPGEVKHVIDSLLNILKTSSLDPEQQIDLYNEIAKDYEYYNKDKHISYTLKALEIAEKTNNLFAASRASGVIGISYDVKMMYDSAYYYHQKSVELAEKIKDEESLVIAYRFFCYSYYRQSQYAKALEYCMKVLHISEKRKDEMPVMRDSYIMSLYNIGSLYRELGNLDRALYYLEQANSFTDGKHLTTLYDLGLVYLSQGKLDKAMEYELKAVELGRVGYYVFEVYGMQALAKIYFAKGNYDSTLYYAKESFRRGGEIGDVKQQAKSWCIMSNVYREQKRWRECEEVAVKAWLVDSAAVDTGPELAYNIAIANIYMGNAEKAAGFLRKYDEITKKHNDKSFRESFTGMEMEYETSKKEMRIATLEKEKSFYIGLALLGAIILLLAFGMSFFRYRLNIQKRKMVAQQMAQLEQEKQLIVTQVTLDTETKERKRLARDLHDGLGGLLSAVKLNLTDVKSYVRMDGHGAGHFSKAMLMLDQSINELRMVSRHMMPESLMQYGLKASLEDFCKSIPVVNFYYLGNENVSSDNYLDVLIYRCTHELVNNALKHANASSINVQLIIDEGLVSLSVQDNGRGFDPHAVSSGLGLKNIRTRVAAYNGKVTIYAAPGNGTEVNIEIEQ